ncbi:hypothetical protein BCON_0562g00010 [Botryotinia convoluta]|uniref:N-acetyltransferase domain-containing protein n=1 Tax=Botryotinia convoluta TaxID=54673 RepID=A0A4Z1H9V0_9HELO|nr:hypothetical protein BCON_0562g00010 [Botryotinia convoluta]
MDPDTIVGRGCWRIVLEDEDRDGNGGEEAIDPWWIPEEEKREYAKGVFEIWAEVKGRGRGAHCAVEVIFTSPSHRRLGIGSLILSWGTQKADELGLDCYVEGSQTGVPLYTKHGFKKIRDVEVKPYKEEHLKSEEWKKFDEELVEVLTVMRRPCRRV